MPEAPAKREKLASLGTAERLVAGMTGALLIGTALVVAVAPPDRRIALSQCANAAAGCVVTVDGDLTSIGAVLAAVGAVAVVIALLGVRFNSLKVGGAELGFQKETEGLALAEPAAEGDAGVRRSGPTSPRGDLPIEVKVAKGMGRSLGTTPVAVTSLLRPIADIDPEILRDYRSARKASQRGHFLTHILGPPTQAGQKFSVAIRVTPHRDAEAHVKSATFYLGRSWGDRVFRGRRGPDGRLGITTEAYGPFLALCEVEFDDGARVLLDHYCDFDMGALLST